MTLLLSLAAGLGAAVLLPFVGLTFALVVALAAPTAWLLNWTLPLLIAASSGESSALTWIVAVGFSVLLYMNLLLQSGAISL